MHRRPFFPIFVRIAALVAVGFALAACQSVDVPKYMAPIPADVMHTIDTMGSTPQAPIYVRLFKEESQFEIWKRRTDGTYGLLKTYAICAWSGGLGPKIQEGDRQAPEGFYTVGPAQLNPDSSYYLSFNIGYPNSYDRSLGRTGSNLMVHGACSSAGCYSMTDESVGEIYAIVREAFAGGQRSFQIDAFPFRMTPQNMAKHWNDPNIPFWSMLKVGYDHFEVTHVPPSVAVCDHQYVFDANGHGQPFDPNRACPAYTVADSIAGPLAAKQTADAAVFQSEVARLGGNVQVAMASLDALPPGVGGGGIDGIVTGATTPAPAATTAAAATTTEAAYAAAPTIVTAPPPARTAFDTFFGPH